MKDLKNLVQNPMIFLQVVMMKCLKNHQNQIKRKHGKLKMFMQVRTRMNILIVDDLGR